MDMTGHASVAPAPWVTTAEAAVSLGLHEETIREMLRDGRLHGVKLGKAQQHRWRVYVSSIERLQGAEPVAAGA